MDTYRTNSMFDLIDLLKKIKFEDKKADECSGGFQGCKVPQTQEPGEGEETKALDHSMEDYSEEDLNKAKDKGKETGSCMIEVPDKDLEQKPEIKDKIITQRKVKEQLFLCNSCSKTFRANEAVCVNCKSSNVEKIEINEQLMHVYDVKFELDGKEDSTRVEAYDEADAKDYLKKISKLRGAKILGVTKVQEDKIPGGLADKSKSEDFDKEQLDAGTKIEMEHTKDQKVAQEIAMDHLTEDPDYYKKLKKVESGKGNPCPKESKVTEVKNPPSDEEIAKFVSGILQGIRNDPTVAKADEPIRMTNDVLSGLIKQFRLTLDDVGQILPKVKAAISVYTTYQQHPKIKSEGSTEESKIVETVKELISETPGISVEDQKILNWALDNKVIDSEFPIDDVIFDALSKVFEDPMMKKELKGVHELGAIDKGDWDSYYLKYVMLPKAKEAYASKGKKDESKIQEQHTGKVYRIDIDGVLTNEVEGSDYVNRTPNIDNINKVNFLYKSGAEVILWTHRSEADRSVTEDWLEKNNVKYTDLELDKPRYDWIVDDRCISLGSLVRESKDSDFTDVSFVVSKNIPKKEFNEIKKRLIDYGFEPGEEHDDYVEYEIEIEGEVPEIYNVIMKGFGKDIEDMTDIVVHESKVQEQEKDSFVTVAKGIVDKAEADKMARDKKGIAVVDELDPKKWMVIVKESKLKEESELKVMRDKMIDIMYDLGYALASERKEEKARVLEFRKGEDVVEVKIPLGEEQE